MPHTITIIGTGVRVLARLCPICPGQARIASDRFEEHMEHHRTGDNLECCKCGHTLDRDNFSPNVNYASPICNKCRPKSAQRRGKGRPPVPAKVTMYVGRGGMGRRYGRN